MNLCWALSELPALLLLDDVPLPQVLLPPPPALLDDEDMLELEEPKLDTLLEGLFVSLAADEENALCLPKKWLFEEDEVEEEEELE